MLIIIIIMNFLLNRTKTRNIETLYIIKGYVWMDLGCLPKLEP